MTNTRYTIGDKVKIKDYDAEGVIYEIVFDKKQRPIYMIKITKHDRNFILGNETAHVAEELRLIKHR